MTAKWLGGSLDIAPLAPSLDWQSSEDMHYVLTGLSKAGSWALWNGIFNKYWLQILSAGGLSHSEAIVLTKQLSEIIADYRARMHCARFSKDKAVEAEKLKNRIELADKYINKHYKCKYNDLLEDILYTAHSHSKAYFLSKGIRRKEKWIAWHTQYAAKAALIKANNHKRCKFYNDNRANNPTVINTITRASTQTTINNCTNLSPDNKNNHLNTSNMSSQTPEIADRTNRKRKDPAPSSQPNISSTKEYTDESNEDLTDSDEEPTSNLSSSPGAPKRCQRIQLITGTFTLPKKKFARKRIYCVIGLEPHNAIGTDVPITQTKTGPYTKKIYESDLKNNYIRLKTADLTTTATPAHTCAARGGEGGG